MIVCLEGPDACGKGTQAQLLTQRLNARLWKFPNRETATGRLIYEHLEGKWWIDSKREPAELARDEALVFQALQIANRMEVATEIFQAAAKGNVVFDRYWPSGYAYGRADGLDGEYLINLHRWLPQADLYLLLDIDPADSVRRRPERRDRYENQEGLMERVLQHYHELWAQHANEVRWAVINARGTVEETAALINAVVAKHREVVR